MRKEQNEKHIHSWHILRMCKKILDEGFSQTRDTTWCVSEQNYIYVRKLPNDIEEKREVVTECIESAQVTAALFKSHSDKVCLFAFEIDEDDVDEDYSCENMMYGCYEVSVSLLNSIFAEIKCIEIQNGYIPDFRVCYLQNLINHPYFNKFYIDEKIEILCKYMTEDASMLPREYADISLDNVLKQIKC